VPGAGPGTIDAMRDHQLLGFLADRGKRAKYVTSVCTGSLILGAAGLLKGYRATSHWVVRDTVLPLVGATPVNERYVKDRNRITGGGVTSGIDFGLRLVAEFRGEDQARIIQLMGEYDPEPPFQSGSPNTALPQTVAQVRQFASGLESGTAKAARENTFRA
jgi:cyclohexyl-isocyanide hydratase